MKPKVYKYVFNMSAFGARSMKKTMLVTNTKALRKLHGRRASRKVQKSLSKSAKKLARKYVDSQGRVRYSGTSFLKKSQPLAFSSGSIFKDISFYLNLLVWQFGNRTKGF